MRLLPLRGFKPRVRPTRLSGPGLAGGGLPHCLLQVVNWRFFAAATENRLGPGGGSEGRGPIHGHSLPVAAVATSVCGAGSGSGAVKDNDGVPNRIADLGSKLEEAGCSGGGTPRGMGCGWGDHPCWVVPFGRLGWSWLEARRVPGFSPDPGIQVAWLRLAAAETHRRPGEDS
jgi:hypothetical protein